MSREKQHEEEYRSLTIFPPHHLPARLVLSQLAQAEGYNTVSETAALLVRYMQLRVIAEISPCAASLIEKVVQVVDNLTCLYRVISSVSLCLDKITHCG